MEKQTSITQRRTRLTAEERREAIIFAVLPVFAEKGFAATTTKDLAKAAGVSEALLYKHFPSKESLYEHIQQQICTTDSSIHDFVHDLEPGSESIVKMLYLVFKIVFDSTRRHPLGNSIPRLIIQSMLEDGSFTRSFHEPRFKQMLPFMQQFAEVAMEAKEVVPGPMTHFERLWFPQHLAASLRLAVIPAEPVYEYESDEQERLIHAVWFSLRGIGMKDEIIQRYFHPEKLDPIIDDVLIRAGMLLPTNE